MPINLIPNQTGAASRYATQTDIEDVFGAEAVARWSNLNNVDTNPDIGRIQKALSLATGTINDFFRGGPFTIPLPVNTTTTNWAAILAGEWLATSRPHGTDESFSWVEKMADYSRLEMGAYRNELIRFGSDATRISNLPQGPSSVIV